MSSEKSPLMNSNVDHLPPPPAYADPPQPVIKPYSSYNDSHMPRMVVTNQPSVNNYHNVQQINPHPNNSLLIITVCLGFACLVFGGYFTLCCTIPAVVFAVKARDAEMLQLEEQRRSAFNIACGCNLFATVIGLGFLGYTIYFLVTHGLPYYDPDSQPDY